MDNNNIEVIKQEWENMKKEEQLLIEKKEKLMNKITENNLYVDFNGKLQESTKTWGMEFNYSYLSRYLTESTYSWRKHQGEGIIDIGYEDDDTEAIPIIKDIVTHINNYDYVINIINNIIEENLEYAYRKLSNGHLKVLINNKCIDIENLDLNTIDINENLVIKFEENNGDDEGEYEYFSITIKIVNTEDCDYTEDDDILE